MTKGTALHIALNFYLLKFHPEGIALLSELELESLIENAAQRSINYLLSKHKDIATPKILKIEFKRITKLLENFMDEEKINRLLRLFL